MAQQIIIKYAACISHDQARHMHAALPGQVEKLVTEGNTLTGTCIIVHEVQCPECEQDRAEYIQGQLRLANLAPTPENIAEWLRSMREPVEADEL